MPTVDTFIQPGIGSPSQCRPEKEIKEIQYGKEVKLSWLEDDMILHIENSKDSTKKLLELIHKFSQVAEYKKSIIFLYTNNKLSERQIK